MNVVVVTPESWWECAGRELWFELCIATPVLNHDAGPLRIPASGKFEFEPQLLRNRYLMHLWYVLVSLLVVATNHHYASLPIVALHTGLIVIMHLFSPQLLWCGGGLLPVWLSSAR
jgi:hypothetical protein